MSLSHRARYLALTAAALLTSACCTLFHAWTPIPSTPGFWGADDFEGTYKPASGPMMNGTTTFNGEIVFANLPSGVVDDVLPADLQLAPNVGDMPGQHPIVLVFGAQTELRSSAPLITTEAQYGDYRELMLLIPFVRKVGETKWHTWVVRMYLDWQVGVDGGNLLYGYRKDLAVLARDTPHPAPPDFVFKVSQLGVARFNAPVTFGGPLLDNATADTSLPNYRAMKAIFEMPILGAWPPPTGYPSTYICSYFVFDWSAAFARKSSSRFQFVSEFAPNMSQWVSRGAISNLTDGEFGVTGLVWELTMPFTCEF
jgi:hypothetical protein